MAFVIHSGLAEDMTFSHEMRKQSEELLAGRKGKADFVDYEFIDYKGTHNACVSVV